MCQRIEIGGRQLCHHMRKLSSLYSIDGRKALHGGVTGLYRDCLFGRSQPQIHVLAKPIPRDQVWLKIHCLPLVPCERMALVNQPHFTGSSYKKIAWVAISICDPIIESCRRVPIGPSAKQLFPSGWTFQVEASLE
jgi:hypothetical protein